MNQRITKMMLQKTRVTEQQLKKAQAQVRCKGFTWPKLTSFSRGDPKITQTQLCELQATGFFSFYSLCIGGKGFHSAGEES